MLDIQHHALVPLDTADDEVFMVDRLDRREDLDVQVKLGIKGPWHEKAIGGEYTKCGKPLNGYATRQRAYGPLRRDMCEDGCFTEFELSNLLPRDSNSPDPVQ
jgi:hypothetical protein